MRSYKRVSTLADSALRLAVLRESLLRGQFGPEVLRLFLVRTEVSLWSWVDREEEFA